MMLVDKIKNLCEQKEITLTELERILLFGRGTIRNWDKNSPSIDKLKKVSDYFHVSTDYLLGREEELKKLTEKDERDIAKTMLKMKQQLMSDKSLMFDGEIMDEETINLLLQAIEQQERMVKTINKKYIPKKYR